LRKRIVDGGVLALMRQWLKATIVEPNGVRKNPRGKGKPQGDNKVLDGWGRYFKCGYPSRMFGKVNWYVSQRLRSWMNRRSQKGYRLRYADNWHGEFQHLGLLTLTRKRYWQ